MRVLIAGPYGGFNLGDEYILSCIADELRSKGHVVFATSADPAYTRRCHGIESFPIMNPRRGKIAGWDAPLHVDALVVGGGEQVQESRYANPLWGMLPNIAHLTRVARRRRIPVMAWGIGVSPITSPIGRWLVRTSLGRAEAITTRDRHSLDRLVDLGIETSRLVLAADPVFRIGRTERHAGRTYLNHLLGGIGADETVILFAPANDHTIGQRHLPALIHGVKRAAAQIGARVLLKPMDQQARFDLALLARKDLQPDGIVTQLPPEAFSRERLKLLFAGVDLTVSSRMHALILSATQGTPWINIARGSKMIAMAETFNTPYLDTSSLVEQDVVDAITKSLGTSREHWQSRQDPVLQDLASMSAQSLESFERIVRSGASHGLENQPPDG